MRARARRNLAAERSESSRHSARLSHFVVGSNRRRVARCNGRRADSLPLGASRDARRAHVGRRRGRAHARFQRPRTLLVGTGPRARLVGICEAAQPKGGASRRRPPRCSSGRAPSARRGALSCSASVPRRGGEALGLDRCAASRRQWSRRRGPAIGPARHADPVRCRRGRARPTRAPRTSAFKRRSGGFAGRARASPALVAPVLGADQASSEKSAGARLVVDEIAPFLVALPALWWCGGGCRSAWREAVALGLAQFRDPPRGAEN